MIRPPSSPHIAGRSSVPLVMLLVLLSLLPGTMLGIYQFGWPALFLFLITIGSAVLFEAICLKIAGKPVRLYCMDFSALLTGWLLAMTLPPWAPWWIGVLGSFCAIVIGKQIFGGIGQNPFNPAMLARTVLLVSFPLEMTSWIAPRPFGTADAPDAAAGWSITANGIPDLDAVTSASSLGHLRTELGRGELLPDILSSTYDPLASAIGTINGSLGETSAILFLLGGLFLLYKRIISWHIPVAILTTVAAMASIFSLHDPDHYAGPLFHLLNGGLMLGAFYIATDPVTSPVSNLGKIIFGIGAGLLLFIIRTWGSYPEGMAFSVLLMNAATPLIDHYIKPRIYGHPGSRIGQFFRKLKKEG
ncbi:MAG: electron transporter RnfD [Zetaproteobacteria bacterium CG12_big_fil_rev_8_21_14_0_65_54_13]|nr:MAG: electron transporter RnfD [Zetaproteobacteria bacterium CG12_big_fil_rev_8_21_14_0_65_54_13]PJA30102.1 MAG: electron transporter RnfD [Zetaproteobacteria bacterium CG_4_9_14_3_um_filter_54_145]